MSYKKVILFFALSFSTFWGNAQQVTLPENLSLAEAQKTALKNNPRLEIKTINTKVAQKEVAQAKWQKIPQIYANYDLRRNLIIPTTPVPAKAFRPNAKEGELIPLQFSTNWTSNLGINASFDIFNPQQHGQVKEAKQKVMVNKTDKAIFSNQLTFTVGKDYAACIIARKQLMMAVTDTLDKTKILMNTRQKYQAGRLKITDLNQIIADKNKAVSQYLKAVKIFKNTKAQLLTDLGFNPSNNYHFKLTDSLTLLLSKSFSVKKQQHSLSLEKQQRQNKLTNIQLHNAKLGFLPTISLKGFYGSNYYDNNFDIFDTKNWYGNSFVGVSINLPLTKGIDRVKRMEVLKLQQKTNSAQYRVQQNQVRLDRVKAQQDFIYKQKDFKQKQKALSLAVENLRAATKQFNNGRLLAKDLVNSSFLYRQAKSNYLQAAYDLLVARLELQKVGRE